jgi:hypothetical protein
MTILIMTGALLIATGFCGVRLYMLQAQVVELQLNTHKMMFPSQIKAARRAYFRGLLREAYQQKLKRNWAIGFIVVAVIAAGFAINVQFNAIAVDELGNGLIPLMRNVAISATAVAMISAVLLGLSLANWQMQTLSQANQDHDATDLYFTPQPVLTKQLLWRRELGLAISAIAVLLTLSAWVGWLPDPTPGTVKIQNSAVQPSSTTSSSSSATTASSTTSSSASAGSSSWQRTDPNTEYPIDAMKEAKYASASAVKALTDSDLASLYFLEYWALNGIQDSEAAGYAQAGGYSYQVVKDDQNVLTSGDTIMVFNESSATKGQIHLFYAIRNGDQVQFFNMYNSGLVITSFASQFGINTVNGHAAPAAAEIRDSTEPIAQLVTAFKADDAFKLTQSGMTRGADLTY